MCIRFFWRCIAACLFVCLFIHLFSPPSWLIVFFLRWNGYGRPFLRIQAVDGRCARLFLFYAVATNFQFFVVVPSFLVFVCMWKPPIFLAATAVLFSFRHCRLLGWLAVDGFGAVVLSMLLVQTFWVTLRKACSWPSISCRWNACNYILQEVRVICVYAKEACAFLKRNWAEFRVSMLETRFARLPFHPAVKIYSEAGRQAKKSLMVQLTQKDQWHRS